MKIFIHFIAGVILMLTTLSLPAFAQEPQTAQESQAAGEVIGEDKGGGDIWVYKENYVPKKYNPNPEYMVVVDMVLLILIMFAGLYFVLKRRVSWIFTSLTIAALAYLGLIRGGCICPVGVISNVTIGLADPSRVGLVTTIIFLAPLIIALIAGRVFCITGCPLGAIQQLLFKRKKHYKLPDKLNTVLKVVPVLLLVGTVYFALKAQYFLACELEPYKAVFFTGKTWFGQLLSFVQGQPTEAKFLWTFGVFSWIYLIAMLVVGYWIPRPFCRFMCPYGVLIGLVSIFSFKPRRIDEQKCIHCGMCQKACPTQAIVIDRKNKISKLSNYSCVQCNLCSKSCKANAIK